MYFRSIFDMITVCATAKHAQAATAVAIGSKTRDSEVKSYFVDLFL